MMQFENDAAVVTDNNATQYWHAKLAAACKHTQVETAALGIINKGRFITVSHGPPAQEISSSRAPAFCVAKLFTATLVALLERRGKLYFEQAITELLPAHFSISSAINKHAINTLSGITVSHLLSHTHGLDSITVDAAPTSDGFIDHEKVAALLQAGESIFAPGTFYSYGLTGFVLLGIIIEHVTQLTYREVLSTEILAQLTNTQMNAGAADKRISAEAPICPSSGKGLNLSVCELLLFASCYLHPAANPLLLSDSVIATLFQSRTHMPGWSPVISGSGYGWKNFATDSHGHNGTNGRQLMYLRINRAANTAICLIAQSTQRHPGSLASLLIHNTVPELSAAINPQPRMLTGEITTSHVAISGTYGNSHTTFNIRFENTHLALAIITTEDGKATCAHRCYLYPAEGNLFFLAKPWQNIVFVQLVHDASTATRYLWDHTQLWREKIT